ncbi:hypothetical protein [Paraburkholderia aspalathi]|uniref:Uncharacterized protein n=1 Tax=Paraburkholderia aspalathi TaxID=1324617 RepID=A0A1I7EQY6_9BURK|nr:hypothetical protein [Paraburkholderia aspalathi]SFU26322.1 hypothetical protein SAMN05192563_105212 [Paraburkholderia aspalathi]
MNDAELDNHEAALKSAMISAILLLAEMDQALHFGCAEVKADEILTKLEEFAPLSIAEVIRFGLREQFLAHITMYGSARTIALQWRDPETYFESYGKLSFEDVLYILDADEWNESHPAFYSLITSIAPTVERILDDRFGIPF